MLGTNNSNLATIIFINIYGGMIMTKKQKWLQSNINDVTL